MSMGQQVLKVLAVWFLAAGAAGADAWDKDQFARLASGDDAEIQQAVTDLAARYDQAHYALMRGLFSGEVYRWSEREVQSGLVLIGDEEMDEYGDSIVPLFTAYPESVPILGEDGEQVKVSLYDIEEVETNRKIRALIQPYLLQMELFHSDADKRRIAAEISATRVPPLPSRRCAAPSKKRRMDRSGG